MPDDDPVRIPPGNRAEPRGEFPVHGDNRVGPGRRRLTLIEAKRVAAQRLAAWRKAHP